MKSTSDSGYVVIVYRKRATIGTILPLSASHTPNVKTSYLGQVDVVEKVASLFTIFL